jgi:hypothetical protein
MATSGVSPIAPRLDAAKASVDPVPPKRPGGAGVSNSATLPADRADLATALPPEAAAHFAAAQQIQRTDRALESIGGMLQELGEQLGFVKLYPPYPPDEPKRAALIRSLLQLKGAIDGMSGAIADQRKNVATNTSTALDDLFGTAGEELDASALGSQLGQTPHGLARAGSRAFLSELQ